MLSAGEAKDACRKKCMSTVSLTNEEENGFIKQKMVEDKISDIWTLGKKCEKETCQDRHIWIWKSTRIEFKDWSNLGPLGKPQPDNYRGNEDCLTVLNNKFGDGVKWHDEDCDNIKYYVCQDDDELLQEMRVKYPESNL